MPQREYLINYSLTDRDSARLQELAYFLCRTRASPATPGFYDSFPDIAQHLPLGLRDFLDYFRRAEPAAACLIDGFPAVPGTLAPTPATWEDAARARTILHQEIFLAVCAMALGEPFSWASLQEGRLIQDILPVPGHEQAQDSHGSDALLELHTEDGFHPGRCDYLMLFGVRNDRKIPTIVSAVQDVQLAEEDAAILRQQRFYMVPDDQHIQQLQARDPRHPALARIMHMRANPDATAVLFGDHAHPYIRVDRPFMRCVDGDHAAERALDVLMAELTRVQRDIPVASDTLLVVDNYQAVHGRRPFRAHYDGTDRWLKKLTVRRDMRKYLDPGYAGSSRVCV